jgi:hypothetical protein
MISSVEGPGPAMPTSLAKRLGCRVRLLDDDAAVFGTTEGDLAAGAYSQVIADRFWDRHLTLARNCGCHRGPPKVILQKNYGNTAQIVQFRRWLIAS